MTKGGSKVIQFIEPKMATKRQGVIDKRFGKTRETVQELQEQLMALRKRAIGNVNKNFRKFKTEIVSKDNLTLKTVRTPAEAVNYISEQTQDMSISRIDLSKSNSLRVLEPELIKSDFETIHTYDFATASGNLGIFRDLEMENYWSLHELELENSFQSFNVNPDPIAYSRQLISKATNKKDFVGLIGANVFSATGEVLAVQHLFNISSILTHAKQTFLVLTLDKLVDSYSDALFQARCTAMYGVEQIILDLFDTERGIKKDKIQKTKKSSSDNQVSSENNYEKYRPPKNLHIIILNDPRLNMVGSKHEDLLYCISCRKCGLRCPRIRASDKQNNQMLLTARELLMDGLLYGQETAIDRGLFNCTLCRSCSNICPLGIELADHLQDLRETCQKSDLFAEPHKRIRKNILEVGNAYGKEHTQKKQVKPGGKR